MNLNPMLLGLEEVTGLEVAQDIHDGAGEYVTFHYDAEYCEEYGDNREILETAEIQVSITLSMETNYFDLAKRVKAYLAKNEAYDIRMTTYAEQVNEETRVRRVVYECKFTKEA